MSHTRIVFLFSKVLSFALLIIVKQSYTICNFYTYIHEILQECQVYNPFLVSELCTFDYCN